MLARVFNRRFAGNYLSTLAFIALSWWVISDLSSFHRGALQGQWQFGMFDVDAVLTQRPVPPDQKPSLGCNIKWKPGNEPDYYGR